LEAVLGPLTDSDDAVIRSVFDECDEKLIGLARLFGHERAGWEGTGLELSWYPSGQVMINSFVETGLGSSKCVSFCVELRPAWMYGEKSAALAWEIEAEIYADCQHKIDHGSMDRVHELPAVRATSAIDAATALRNVLDDLVRLAHENSLEHWLRLASDEVPIRPG
jgi:hypothetical protein